MLHSCNSQADVCAIDDASDNEFQQRIAQKVDEDAGGDRDIKQGGRIVTHLAGPVDDVVDVNVLDGDITCATDASRKQRHHCLPREQK